MGRLTLENLQNARGLAPNEQFYDTDIVANLLGSLGAGSIGAIKRRIRTELKLNHIEFKEAAKLTGGGRVDFLLTAGIAIICSDEASVSSLQMVVARALRSRSVEGVVVVTTRNFSIPQEIFGKEVSLIHASGGLN